MTSPARDRKGHQPPQPAEPRENGGYQPREPVSAKALANPPRGGSSIRPPAAPPKK